MGLAGLLGPPLLGIPAAPIVAASLLNCLWEAVVIGLTRRAIPLPSVWGLAFVTTALGTVGIIAGFWLGGRFLEAAAPVLMLNGVTAIGLVRLTAWLAAAIGAIQVVLFAIAVIVLSEATTGAFEAFLLTGTMVVATVGSRYLEGAERVAFAQSHLVAELHQRIDRLFRQYLSPDVAQALVENPLRAELGGEVAEVVS